jgi:branched-chain amino acid transport system ATP-binding protein
VKSDRAWHVDCLQRGRIQRHKRGLAIVLVEQNLEFIRRLSDRVLIIQKGRITGQLAPDDLGDEDLVAEFVGMSR